MEDSLFDEAVLLLEDWHAVVASITNPTANKSRLFFVKIFPFFKILSYVDEQIFQIHAQSKRSSAVTVV